MFLDPGDYPSLYVVLLTVWSGAATSFTSDQAQLGAR